MVLEAQPQPGFLEQSETILKPSGAAARPLLNLLNLLRRRGDTPANPTAGFRTLRTKVSRKCQPAVN